MNSFIGWGVLLLWVGFHSAEAARLMRGPYLQLGTPNSITIKWRTLEPTDSVVRYGPAMDDLITWHDAVLTTEHQVRLTGLSPNQKYFYEIGSSTQTLSAVKIDQYFITHPTPGTQKPTRIWAIGDCGTASHRNFDSRKVRQAYDNFRGTNHTDVWLMLGDNAYWQGWDYQYQVAVFESYPTLLPNTILWTALGNHDTYMNPGGPLDYFSIFTLPAFGEAGGVPSGTENFYSFDYANIHFVCLDSELSSRSRGGVMWNWLEQDLQANTNEWLIAFWHSPPYSKGSHDSDNPYEANMVAMRTNFVSLLEAYGVDLVLCGHSHIYERSYLLHGHYGFSTSLQPTMIMDDGSGRPDDTGPYVKSADPGAVYIVAGNGGWTSPRTGHHPVMFFDELRIGSVVIDVNTNRMDVKFLRETGAIDDYFSIVKGVPPEALRIVAFYLEDGELFLRWKSIAGHSYQIEWTSTLQPRDWTPLSPPVGANGATTTWRGPIPGGSPGFFRIREL